MHMGPRTRIRHARGCSQTCAGHRWLLPVCPHVAIRVWPGASAQSVLQAHGGRWCCRETRAGTRDSQIETAKSYFVVLVRCVVPRAVRGLGQQSLRCCFRDGAPELAKFFMGGQAVGRNFTFGLICTQRGPLIHGVVSQRGALSNKVVAPQSTATALLCSMTMVCPTALPVASFISFLCEGSACGVRA